MPLYSTYSNNFPDFIPMARSHDSIATTDSELLMQFVRQRNEDAFRQLFERHATLVMHVCRQVTRNEQDAEDAFQATLLVLIRRADRLLHITSFAGWLHRVAFRIALRAKNKRARQRETQLVDEPCGEYEEVMRAIHARDLQRVLHEELSNIARRYRNAIVLCDLEGKTGVEAAAHLDCTEAAVKAALARGRRLLRCRLIKRGALLSAGILSTHRAVAATRVAPEIIERTFSICCSQLSPNAASTVPFSVHTLANEGTKLMIHSALMKTFAILTIAILLIIPVTLLGQTSIGESAAGITLAVESTVDVGATTGVVHVLDAGTSVASDEETASKADDADDAVDPLVDELIETLQQLVESSEARFQAGTGDFDSVFRARDNLNKAQLNFVRSRAERMRVLEERLKNYRAMEHAIEQQHEAGRASTEQMLTTKVERLEAEIAVRKERAVADPRPENASLNAPAIDEFNLTSVGINADTDVKTSPTWIAVYQPPSADGYANAFQVQISHGADTAIIEPVTNGLRSNPQSDIQLIAASKLDLHFRSDSFLVIRVNASEASLAPGNRFPVHTLTAITKQLKASGIERLTLASLEELVQRVETDDPFGRVFRTLDSPAQ